nr:bifunctional folylpolyglutamate synthase/dihydrofolate synthase [Gemmatimonadota bacterium]
VEIVPDFVSALERAVEESAPGGTVVVTGSHYTVGAALRALGRAPHPSP